MEAEEQGFRGPRGTFTIKLWPPSKTTRAMLVERMTKNLSAESIFSRKYGLLSEEEARLDAEELEETGYAIANDFFEKGDDDGSSTVQLYAKETSKLMLEVIKRGPKQKKNNGSVDKLDMDSTRPKMVFDISGGQRAFLEGEEAEELLKPLTVEGSLYSKICISNRSFGLDAANIAGPIFASLKHQLNEVDLSDFIAGRPEDEALEVMRIFSKALEGCVLRYLNLSNNALGEKGVRAFDSLLKSQNNLEELYLMNDGISPEAAEAVCELIPSTEKLKVLHFHNNMSGDEGGIAIAAIVKKSLLLEDFRCSSTRVDSVGGVKLAESLGTCLHLKKIDIRDNMFGIEAGIVLSKTIQKLHGLTELYLSYLNLEDEGSIAILKALKEVAPSLEVMEIAGNGITSKAVNVIVEFISLKQNLHTLNLSENELMDEGAIEIGKTLEKGNAKLKELDMSCNEIRRAGARCLVQAVVTNKPEFTLLNINGNAISDEGIDEVKEILKSANSGDVLGPLDENDVDGEGGSEGEEVEVEVEVGQSELESQLQHLNVGGT